MLLIEMGKTKIKLFSTPIEEEQGFADSSLYPLYNLVLSRTVGLKAIVVEDIKKEIIAFANCEGGKIYIGVEDDGNLCFFTMRL
jgi:hypothetical protein